MIKLLDFNTMNQNIINEIVFDLVCFLNFRNFNYLEVFGFYEKNAVVKILKN